jgi:DNA modification methylase
MSELSESMHKEGWTMTEKIITKEEQSCIGQCINKYWGHTHENIEDDDERDKKYEQCLSSCKVCG